MNEQANTRLVQQAYQRIGQGDMPALLKCSPTDIQWQVPEMENMPFAVYWSTR